MNTEPWRRVAPITIPTEPSIAEALDTTSDDDVVALVHANLLPRDPTYRGAWTKLWAIIAADENLTNLVGDALEDWLDQADQAESTETDPKTLKRIAKFRKTAEAALNRLDQPLAWAGPVARRYNRPARRTLDDLVHEITTHRDNTAVARATDQDLWSVLAELDLDPDSDLDPSAPIPDLEPDDDALAETGDWGAKFMQPGRTAIAEILAAVDQHCEDTADATSTDRELWAAVDRITDRRA